MWFRVWSILAVLGFLQLPPPATHASRGFVEVSGTGFTVGGRPFYVAGANNHYLPWGSDAEIDAVLNDARALRFNVVRTFLDSVIGSRDLTTVPTIWPGGFSFADTGASVSEFNTRGTYFLYWDTVTNRMAINDGPTGLQRVDYLLMRAGQLDLKLNLALLNFWPYHGGQQQIARWYGSSDPYTFFFQDPRPRADYRRWVSHVLNRVNTYTGVRYKDDPTIFAWDLMNEPETSSVALKTAWLTEMAAYVKAIDPNHLVTTGDEGFYTGQGGSDFEAQLAIPQIDFGVYHSYPRYHYLSPAQVVEVIERHSASGVKLGKPVLLQEFGYGADEPDQAAVYRSWVEAVARSGGAGWLVWRLTSREATGTYPPDNGEQFDLHNDGGPTIAVLAAAAAQPPRRNSVERASGVVP